MGSRKNEQSGSSVVQDGHRKPPPSQAEFDRVSAGGDFSLRWLDAVGAGPLVNGDCQLLAAGDLARQIRSEWCRHCNCPVAGERLARGPPVPVADGNGKIAKLISSSVRVVPTVEDFVNSDRCFDLLDFGGCGMGRVAGGRGQCTNVVLTAERV